MLINASNGYDSCIIEVSEHPDGHDNYLMRCFDANEPALFMEFLQSKYAKDLIENQEDAQCLDGDGSDEDIWCRPNRERLMKASYYGYSDIIEAILTTESAYEFMNKLMGAKYIQSLMGLWDFMRESGDYALDDYISNKYGFDDNTMECDVLDALIEKECANDIREVCKLFKKIKKGS